MATVNQTQFEKNIELKQIIVTRNFNATREDVWSAWSESELLDQWWAPKPWRAETRTMDFREGGFWLYAMVGPEDQKQWCKVDYIKIERLKKIEGQDFWCDENGIKNQENPTMDWKNEFSDIVSGTRVVVNIQFSSERDIQTLIDMGFEAGFTAALSNLDQYLETGFKIRKSLKTNNRARVSTYLNFPGNTEEAFNFYKKVFKSEFLGQGIQRFGDIPQQEGHPPIDETVKKMILHVELPIVAGHILMGTDAPKEMGFNLTKGNNVHISLEPESREETKRLFDELSMEGTVSMPLADMFWGAYYGSCTDKYGINWMFNFQMTEQPL